MAWFYGHYLSGRDGSADDARGVAVAGGRRPPRVGTVGARRHRRVRPAPRRGRRLRRGAWPRRASPRPTSTSAARSTASSRCSVCSTTARSAQALVAEAVHTAFAKSARPTVGANSSIRAIRADDVPPATSTARRRTASSIGRVSHRVNVFCCDGWNEPSRVGPPSTTTSTPCPNRGRGRRPYARLAASKPNAPRPTTTAGAARPAPVRGTERTSRARPASVRCRWGALDGCGDPHVAQLEPVAGVRGRRLVRQTDGVHGGEQEVAAAVAGEDAPGAVGPWAAGARPTTTIRAAGSPKPGTGRPQYVSSRTRPAARRPPARATRPGGHTTGSATTSSSRRASVRSCPAPPRRRTADRPVRRGCSRASSGSAKAPECSKYARTIASRPMSPFASHPLMALVGKHRFEKLMTRRPPGRRTRATSANTSTGRTR